MAAVRPEFRQDLLVPDQDDPVLGWRSCQVAGCDRPCVEYALCRGHGQRWRKRGYPDQVFDGAQDSYGGGGEAALGMPMRV